MSAWHRILIATLIRCERMVAKYQDAQKRLYAYQSIERDWCVSQVDHFQRIANWCSRRFFR